MPKKNTYNAAQLGIIQQVLRKAATEPPPQRERLSRAELLEAIRPEFEELRRKDYTLAQISKIISEGLGDAIGAPILQQFFERNKRSKRKARVGNNQTNKAKSAANSPTKAERTAQASPNRAPYDAVNLRERS